MNVKIPHKEDTIILGHNFSQQIRDVIKNLVFWFRIKYATVGWYTVDFKVQEVEL